jgi:hypothetical protein
MGKHNIDWVESSEMQSSTLGIALLIRGMGFFRLAGKILAGGKVLEHGNTIKYISNPRW